MDSIGLRGLSLSTRGLTRKLRVYTACGLKQVDLLHRLKLHVLLIGLVST